MTVVVTEVRGGRRLMTLSLASVLSRTMRADEIRRAAAVDDPHALTKPRIVPEILDARWHCRRERHVGDQESGRGVSWASGVQEQNANSTQ
jgi:hypothetical protein